MQIQFHNREKQAFAELDINDVFISEGLVFIKLWDSEYQGTPVNAWSISSAEYEYFMGLDLVEPFNCKLVEIPTE